jgi:hypothetical protein
MLFIESLLRLQRRHHPSSTIHRSIGNWLACRDWSSVTAITRLRINSVHNPTSTSDNHITHQFNHQHFFSTKLQTVIRRISSSFTETMEGKHPHKRHPKKPQQQGATTDPNQHSKHQKDGNGANANAKSPASTPANNNSKSNDNQKMNTKPKVKPHSKSTNAKHPSSSFNIETSNFQTNFIAQCNGAIRYKVHAPNCSCPKIRSLRQRYRDHRDGNTDLEAQPQKSNVSSGEWSESATETSMYSNHVQFDIDGGISRHFTQQLNISNSSKDDPFNNLVVVPDTKTTPAIYICNDTNSQQFRADGSACERKLALQIFGNSNASNEESPLPFKVNCAICLLTTHQRNGFVAIVSNTLEELQSTIYKARNAAIHKLQSVNKNGTHGQLHADHAHFVCAIQLSTLQSLLNAGKTRSKSQQVSLDILTQMDRGGVELPTELFAAHQPPSSVNVAMGHHLTSLLYLLRESTNSTLNNFQYIMTIGYHDEQYEWSLDLPGGKRHLGESTLEGAIREVNEECSLSLDSMDWIGSFVHQKYGGRLNASTKSTPMQGQNEGGFVSVLEPRRVKGNLSGDAFIVIAPTE